MIWKYCFAHKYNLYNIQQCSGWLSIVQVSFFFFQLKTTLITCIWVNAMWIPLPHLHLSLLTCLLVLYSTTGDQWNSCQSKVTLFAMVTPLYKTQSTFTSSLSLFLWEPLKLLFNTDHWQTCRYKAFIGGRILQLHFDSLS